MFGVQISQELSARKWVKRRIVLATKMVAKCVFGTIMCPFGGGRQKFAGQRAM